MDEEAEAEERDDLMAELGEDEHGGRERRAAALADEARHCVALESCCVLSLGGSETKHRAVGCF